MTPANLNADVLSATCQFLTDVSDVLSFSLTCSSLRPIATQRLLSIRPIPLTDGASLRKFHFFLFANAPARTPYVHTVQITWGSEVVHQPPPDADLSLLIDILTSCPNLKSIPVYFRGPCHPRIFEAIGTLPNIRELGLSIYGWSKDAHALLYGIRAPLRVLRLQSEDSQWQYSGCLDPSTLEDILLRLAPTLEELELGGFTVDSREMPSTWGMASSPPLSTMSQYPSICSLNIGCIMGRLLLDRLQHVFPGLHRTLSIQYFVRAPSRGSYADIRAANKLLQCSDPARLEAWTKLDRLACNPVIFYVLALRCPIRLVMLRRVYTETRSFVTDALRENAVPRLQLELELDGGLGVLDGLFPPELAGTLTHLTLVFKYANAMRPETKGDPGPHPLAHLKWHDVFDRTVSALRPLHMLTHLRLVVETNVCHFFYFLPIHSNDFVRAVHGSSFDFAAIAAALVPSLPSLRYLLVATDGRLSNYGEWNTAATKSVYEQWHATKGWRVAREEAGADDDGTAGTHGGEPVLVELADAVAETIVWKEELFTSCKAEYRGLVPGGSGW